MLKEPTLYESLVRIGLVVVVPDAIAGSIVDEPVSTLDLAATFYDYAGVNKPIGVQSESLRNFINGKEVTSRDCAYYSG